MGVIASGGTRQRGPRAGLLPPSEPSPVIPTAIAWLPVLRAGSGGFEVPRAPVLAVVTVAGVAMVCMGTGQVRDPEWSATRSARHRARREGLDPERAEPTEAAVERARRGGYVLLGLGTAFLLLAATQVR